MANPTADELPEQAPPTAPTSLSWKLRFLTLKNRAETFLWSRQPKLIPTIMTFLCVPLLLGLGSWQMHRLHEKNTLLVEMEKNLATKPEDLRLQWPQDKANWSALNYRPVVLQGHWSGVRSFKLAPRTFEGQVGYQLIVPLRLKDDQIVLINRGFIPDGDQILPFNENETIVITGIARVMETEKPIGGIENVPSRNQWVWPDIAAMGYETGFSRVAPILVYETRDPKRDTYPIGGQLPLPAHNRHWHYAVTWYALAFIMMGVYVMSMTPKQDKKTDDQNKAANDDALDPVAKRGMYPEATD